MINLIVNKSEKKLITFLNPYSYLLARKNKQLFENFTIKIDGILLVKVLKVIGFRTLVRESFDMTSLAPIVFSEAIKNNQSLYFIGTKPDIIEKAINNIKNEFPQLNIIGFHHGYFKNIKENLQNNILQINPNIIVCGMGTPLQENFLLEMQNLGWDGIGYTCGGYLHQTANNINYYPYWINKLNLRWFYRMIDEPKLIKRYFMEYPKFFCFFILDYFFWKYEYKLEVNK